MLRTYITEIRLVDGRIFAGPEVKATNEIEAELILNYTGRGYALVVGYLC